MSTTEMNEKVRKAKKLKASIATMEKELQSIEAMIKAEMLRSGLEELNVGFITVRYAKIRTARFDTAGFKMARPDLYAQYQRQTENYRLCIT